MAPKLSSNKSSINTKTPTLHYTFLDASAGGNVTLIRFNAFPKGAVFPDPVVLATGRAITSEVILSDKSLNQCHINILNIHNESIEDTDFDSILSWTKRSGRLASLHPEKYVVIAAGDFNFDSEDNMAVSLSANLAKIHRSHSAQNAPALQAALASYVEVSTKTHTHYHKRSNSLSCIDKIYICCPAWFLIHNEISGRTSENPVKLSDVGISDHAPFSVRIGAASPPKPQHQQAIPNFICKSPEFSKLMDVYVQSIDIDNLADFESFQLGKSGSSQSIDSSLSPHCAL